MFVVGAGEASACLPAECQIRFLEVLLGCQVWLELSPSDECLLTNSLEAEFMVKFFQFKMQKETLGWKASRRPWLYEPISGWNTVIDGHYYVEKKHDMLSSALEHH